MFYFLAAVGGAAMEWLASYLIGKYKIKSIIEKDVAYLEAKAAALKKTL